MNHDEHLTDGRPSDWLPDCGWIDATAGASGDMLLGALIDAGAAVSAINAALATLDLPERPRVDTRQVTRGGLHARLALVTAPDTTRARPWSTIRGLLTAAALPAGVRRRALHAFELLAAAEARVHGVAAEDVIFHEVGGLDALADIVGVSAGLEDLGLRHISCSPVAVGSGTVRTEHGTLPVPTPATVELLATMEATACGTAIGFEACTPTGAALLAANVDSHVPPSEFRVQRVGTGAGTRDPADHPNVLRLLVGARPQPRDPAGTPSEPALELIANVDDTDPRIWPYVIERCLRAGADDAWIVPIRMKKGRPAVSVHVLCRPQAAATLGAVLVTETSTIGYRVRPVEKVALDRREVTVSVDGRPIRVKLAYLAGKRVNYCAEYEDSANVARETGRPLREVLRTAVELARSDPKYSSGRFGTASEWE